MTNFATNKLIKKMLDLTTRRSVPATMAMLLLFSSCVNEEYDLDKGIDKEMTILKNLSLPVGNFEKIVLTDMLELDDNSIIHADENNDLVLSFAGEGISTDITLPEVKFNDDITTHPIHVEFNTKEYAKLDASVVKEMTDKIIYSEITGSKIDKDSEIIIGSELPEEVVAIRSIDLNADLILRFSVNYGAIHLAEGLEMVFPEDIVICKNDNLSSYEIVDSHIVKIKEDLNISESSPLEIDLRITTIAVPADAIKNGVIELHELIHLNADFYLRPDDFDVIPEEIAMDVDIDLMNLEILSADMMLDVKAETEDIEMEISDIPDFLTGENISIDIYNPAIRLSVDNTSPFAFNVKGDIVSSSNGVSTAPLSIGTNPVMTIPAESDVTFVISRRGKAMAGNVVDLIMPDMMKLINPLPEMIKVSNLEISSSGTDYITLVPGSTYSASIGYEVYAPLAFDSNMALSFDYDIEGLGLEFDGITVSRTSISMTLVNSIPVGFGLSAQAVDSDGNVVDNIVLTVDEPVRAGSHISPSEQNITIDITNHGDTFSLSALRLHLNASADQNYLGVPLNTAQGLEIKDLVFNLPEGITLNIENESIDQ